jgi:hypothetical protein
MKDDERHWWMALADSEALLARASHRDVLYQHMANCEIRRILRDRFGVDFDKRQYEAAATVHDLVEKYRLSADAEKTRRAEFDRVLAEAQELLRKS